MSVRDLIILGCASQQPTRTRNHGAYLLRWNQEGLLFDPGEGTQRQLIFANIPPPKITRIFISHFHGDHCLGLGSVLMRLNLDKITHPVWCYYPSSGKKYFDRLRYGAAFCENINVIEVPIRNEGLVHRSNGFTIEAYKLRHSIETWAYRITESDCRKFYKKELHQRGIRGFEMQALLEKGHITNEYSRTEIDEVSFIRKGDTFASIIDTLPCAGAIKAAQDAKLLLCESTYLEIDRQLAQSHYHLTAKQAALIAKKAGAQHLVLTHYSARYGSLSPFLDEAKEVFSRVSLAEDLKVIPFER